ncbi:hypothetical protein J1C67_16740 [Clostridium gasigenes]|uniref:hypothetical protein n=1 Tax=Clostridium gasigenes TaxID=94869 RepID=UPI001438385E|nr:hypothetical protein [Clostridium gasigenes]NKF05729.1 hypothetical protein [Clostridium gasigenes]QSW19162.1 hypothetical protein J1C67_16740 [Clostridium gasigenes]
MGVIDIVIPLFFIAIILKQLRYIKELIISTRKSYVEIITVLFAVIIFIGIIYFYANTWMHYITGILGIFMFVSMWIKQGINSKGFISMYKYKEIILWNEIEKVMVISSKDIKIELSGRFMEQTFHFKTSDYDKVMTILKEKIPGKFYYGRS